MVGTTGVAEGSWTEGPGVGLTSRAAAVSFVRESKDGTYSLGRSTGASDTGADTAAVTGTGAGSRRGGEAGRVTALDRQKDDDEPLAACDKWARIETHVVGCSTSAGVERPSGSEAGVSEVVGPAGGVGETCAGSVGTWAGSGGTSCAVGLRRWVPGVSGKDRQDLRRVKDVLRSIARDGWNVCRRGCRRRRHFFSRGSSHLYILARQNVWYRHIAVIQKASTSM